MAATKNLLITVTLAVAAAIVLAKPHERREAPLLTLTEVVNKTMCPIKIFYDKNEGRIPRVIKHLKCAEMPNQLCTKTRHGCCKHRHSVDDVNFTTKCVEIEDTVLVTYKNSPVPQTLPVSVGCSCMMQEFTEAPEVR